MSGASESFSVSAEVSVHGSVFRSKLQCRDVIASQHTADWQGPHETTAGTTGTEALADTAGGARTPLRNFSALVREPWH